MATADNIIAICVATYKRPFLLKNCLSAIQLLNLPDNYKTILIIVDNDINETGRCIVEDVCKNFSMPVYYFVESERGIATVRNRLLQEALNHGAKLIGFIDDDEFPGSGWLINHTVALHKFNADVVTGPVVSTLETTPLDEIKINYKFNTGHIPRHVAAGNVLFKSELTSQHGLWFDTTYNFTGGEDFHFFDRSSEKGHVHIWVADAIIYETIIKERTTKKYLFFRHFTGAINNVIQYKFNNGISSTWIHFLIKALGKIIGALITFIAYLITFKAGRLEKSIIKLASAAGYISGLLNIIVERYR